MSRGPLPILLTGAANALALHFTAKGHRLLLADRAHHHRADHRHRRPFGSSSCMCYKERNCLSRSCRRPVLQWRLKSLLNPEPLDLVFVNLAEVDDQFVRRQQLLIPDRGRPVSPHPGPVRAGQGGEGRLGRRPRRAARRRRPHPARRPAEAADRLRRAARDVPSR